MLTARLFAGRFAAPGRFLHVLFKINFASFRVIEFDSLRKAMTRRFAESHISWSRVRRDQRVQVGHLLPGEAALLERNGEGKPASAFLLIFLVIIVSLEVFQSQD